MNLEMLRGRAPRKGLRTVVLGSAVLLLAGCQFGGLNTLNMPGAKGHGPGSFTITMEIPDVATLPQNSPVMVDDVTVGSVSGVEAVQRPDGSFYAAVKLSLQKGVDLPANSTANVAQTSLLGSQHVALVPPKGEPAIGKLADGSNIALQNAGRYPTTEETLAALGVVVNKGNLGALQDITDEAYIAFAGRSGSFTDLFPRLAQLTAGLDDQTDEIIAAADGLNRFGAILARDKDSLSRALDSLPDAVRVLNDNRTNIVDAFAALRTFATVASRVLSATKDDFTEDLKGLYSIVKASADSADDLVNSLQLLPTFPFPSFGIKQAVRGDFLNVFVTLDFTLRRLGETIFTTSYFDPNMKHLNEVVNPPDWLLGETANLSGQAADPFTIPPGQADQAGAPR